MDGYAGLPPGPLAAYLGVRDQSARTGAVETQQAGTLMSILAQQQQMQQAAQLRQALASGDPAALMKLPGGAEIVQRQVAVQKAQQEMELNKQFANMGQMDPDALDRLGQKLAIGGHPGAATVMSIADKRRATDAGKAALTSMQTVGAQPAQAPVTAVDDSGLPNPGVPAVPGKGGATDFLQASPFPAVANSAKALQARIDAGQIPVDRADAAIKNLTAMHAAEQSKIDAAARNQANRIELKITPGAPTAPRAGAGGPAEAFPADAMEAAAARYKLDGTLPPNLGRGNQGAANTAKILSRAAQMATEEGNTPEAARLNQIAAQARTGALKQMEKQATMVGAFEKNANMNADLALQFSEKADRTGVPVFNRWLLAGQKELLGDPDVTKFNTANYTFINEYAKVVSGSMGNTAITDSARKHANDVLSTSQTKDQYKQNIGLLKTEMRNRMLGFDQQRQELMGGMSGKAAAAGETPAPQNRRATDAPGAVKTYNPATGKIE